jgi:hypothetical protein
MLSHITRNIRNVFPILVDGVGVEPTFTESESIVLPAKRTTLITFIIIIQNRLSVKYFIYYQYKLKPVYNNL